MKLYIVRHAWADEQDEDRWPDDRQRPLTAEGRKRFSRVAKALDRRGFAPQLIVTSPLVRCRQTAEVLRDGLSCEPLLVDREELAPGSDLDGLLAWMAGQSASYSEVAWVGHAPDVSDLTAALVGGGLIDFSKGASAAIDFEDLPRRGAGILRWLVTAKMLGE